MGTNYYASAAACPHCQRGEAQIHIGKSSAGWKFLFRSDEVRGLRSWADWNAYLAKPEVDIRDEYDRPVSFDAFATLVASKQDGRTDGFSTEDAAGYRFSVFGEFS